MAKILVRVLLWLLFNKRQRAGLLEIVRSVAADPRIPIFEPSVRFGREARRDEASYRASTTLEIKQYLANLGCELVYFLAKVPNPRKHPTRI